MSESIHQHDISHAHLALLEPHLLDRAGCWGGVVQDNRRFINAVFLDASVLAHRAVTGVFGSCCWRN